MEDQSGTFWMGSGAGLYQFNPKTEKLTSFPVEHIANPYPFISDLLMDTEGILWIGTYNPGVFRLDTRLILTAAQQSAAFNQFIENDKYLSGRRGQYAERNAALMPWLNRFDFRILQDVFTDIGGRRNTLQLSLDILNVGNLLNPAWGIRQGLNNAQALLTPANVSPEGVPAFRLRTVSEDGQTVLPTSPYRAITTTANTWSMQIG